MREDDPNGRPSAAVIVRNAVAFVVGTLLLLYLCYVIFGIGQNISSGGPTFFSGVAKAVAIPTFELGLTIGLGLAWALADRLPWWRTIRRLTKVVWYLAALDFLVLMFSTI